MKEPMTIREKINDVLRKLCLDYCNDNTIGKENILYAQALSQIIDLIIGKLPKKRRTEMYEDEIGNVDLIHNKGFNQCLSKLKTILKGLK
jgi:hypothetical protein